MKIEDHTKIIQDIAKNLTDQAKVTELLAELSTDYAEQTKSLAELPTLKENNEKLRSANMNLFLQVGEISKDTKPGAEQTPPGGEKTPPGGEETKLSFENLFNEKGGLK